MSTASRGCCLNPGTCRSFDRRPGDATSFGHEGSYHGFMSMLLMNLRDVPDDEAEDVRAMLDAQGIAFYETTPSVWGISAGGIWVTEDDAFADARRAMDDYQQQRATRVRAEYAAARRAGTAETFWTLLRAEPVRVVLSLLGILLALGLVVIPYFLLRR